MNIDKLIIGISLCLPGLVLGIIYMPRLIIGIGAGLGLISGLIIIFLWYLIKIQNDKEILKRK